MATPWASDAQEVLAKYSVSAEEGLSSSQVEENRAIYGRNETEAEESEWHAVSSQLANPSLTLSSLRYPSVEARSCSIR